MNPGLNDDTGTSEPNFSMKEKMVEFPHKRNVCYKKAKHERGQCQASQRNLIRYGGLSFLWRDHPWKFGVNGGLLLSRSWLQGPCSFPHFAHADGAHAALRRSSGMSCEGNLIVDGHTSLKSAENPFPESLIPSLPHEALYHTCALKARDWLIAGPSGKPRN